MVNTPLQLPVMISALAEVETPSAPTPTPGRASMIDSYNPHSETAAAYHAE